MQATILIKLGNDAMRSGEDIAAALRQLADKIDSEYPGEPTIKDALDVRDENGNHVGIYLIETRAEL